MRHATSGGEATSHGCSVRCFADVMSGFSRTSVLVADEPGEIALGALALPHLFVDVHQTGARHETLCDLIRQHLGLKEWMMGEDPHVPELVCDCRLELFLRQLVDEVLFDRQQKSSAGVRVSTETISGFFGTTATATLCPIVSFAMNSLTIS